jgi:hypothetical protein
MPRLTASQSKARTRQAKVATLLTAGFTLQEIANKLQVSRPTIYNDSKAIAPALDFSQDILTRLRMSLQTDAPVAARTQTIKKALGKVDSNPFAALKAVQMANYIDGVDQILTPQQIKQADPDQHRPMFAIQDGATVTVNVLQVGASNPQDIVVKGT